METWLKLDTEARSGSSIDPVRFNRNLRINDDE